MIRLHSLRALVLWLPCLACAAYGTTLVVNTLRILGALALYQADIASAVMTPARLHRIEGIVVYYVFLCFFSWCVSRMLELRIVRQGRPDGRNAVQTSLLAVLGPLACYLLYALVIPAFNGAGRRHPAFFIEHGLTLVVISTGLALAWWLCLQGSGYRRNNETHQVQQLYETDHTHCRG